MLLATVIFLPVLLLLSELFRFMLHCILCVQLLTLPLLRCRDSVATSKAFCNQQALLVLPALHSIVGVVGCCPTHGRIPSTASVACTGDCTALHGRFWYAWGSYVRQRSEALRKAVMHHKKAKQTWQRQILQQWSEHTRCLAIERKAQVQS